MLAATPTTRPYFTTKSSYNSSSSLSSMKSNIKLAPSIHSATIISFEKRIDQKIWYLIKINPQKQFYNPTRPYIIARKYEEFVQLSQALHERFNNTKNRAGSRLPPKIKTRLNILPTSKQLHVQRAEELNQFLSILFQTQTAITESYMVLEFFGIQKSDIGYEQNEKQNQDGIKPNEKENLPNCDPKTRFDHRDNNTSRWKRLRCTSFLARSPPSSTALSSLCSQAANRIIPSWHRNHNTTATTCSPQPSVSTPIQGTKLHSSKSFQYRTTSREGLKVSQSTLCVGSIHPFNDALDSSLSSGLISSHPSLQTLASTIVPSPSSSQQLKDTIKIKVIYDADNIIVIQVPRTITLSDLRSRIALKFSDPSMGGIHIQDEVVLLYDDSVSSYCSVVPNQISLPAILINKEQDLSQIMHTKWCRLEKVTLRCIT